jgi:4-carboxymuconolactone decarboxylase
VSAEEARAAGLAKLVEVYGDDRGYGEVGAEAASAESSPYIEQTLEHLFGEIWSRGVLSVRDRRLLTLGVTAALGLGDTAEVQMYGALKNGELTPEQLGEAVVHLAYYAGWPCGQTMRRAAAGAARRRRDDASESAQNG